MSTNPPKKTGPSMARGTSKQDFKTPPDFMQAVQLRFGPIIWDLAAHSGNTQHAQFFSKEMDSLKQEWSTLGNGWLWLNPEFDDIDPWAEKCAKEMKLGAKILFLTPASIGANWYWKHVSKNACVQALQSRMSFDGKHPYPKDLILSVFCHGLRGFQPWDWKGKRAK